jgi:ribonucleotide reductase alpha subunit
VYADLFVAASTGGGQWTGQLPSQRPTTPCDDQTLVALHREPTRNLPDTAKLHGAYAAEKVDVTVTQSAAAIMTEYVVTQSITPIMAIMVDRNIKRARSGTPRKCTGLPAGLRRRRCSRP